MKGSDNVMTNTHKLVDKNKLAIFANAIYALFKSDLATALQTKADKNHNHNTLYYTKTEIDDNLSTINTEITSIKQKNPVTFYVDDNDEVWMDW